MMCELWGLCPQTPRICRFPARIDLDCGSEFDPAPDQSRPRGRRSGRIPAAPATGEFSSTCREETQ
jgi:hypothetical protein